MKEIVEHIDKIVEVFEKVSPMVWDVMVRQQYIIVFSILASLVMCVCVLIVGVYMCGGGDESIGWFILALSGGTGTGLMLIAVIVEGIPRILNPHYYAIQALIPGRGW